MEVHIDQKIERWKESLLVAWLAAWLFVGLAVFFELQTTEVGSERTFYFIFLGFWAFFFFRIGKVFVWRRIGEEIIKISPGEMTIKNAFGKFGRTNHFKLNGLRSFGLAKYDQKSFLQFMDQSFWIIGGEKLGFEYHSKKYRLGKQLSDKDATALARLMDKSIETFKRKK